MPPFRSFNRGSFHASQKPRYLRNQVLVLAKDIHGHEEAALLFERIYPGTATMLQKAELKEAATLVSDYLGLKTVNTEGEGTIFDKQLFLDQDLFSCEYVDAAGSLVESFPCELQVCRMLK